jgi:putative membrane protein
MNLYVWIRALHIVSVVSLFAGLFYLGRLFIYHVEAMGKPEPERAVLPPQYVLMEKRLWYAIINPALVATAVFGLWLMIMLNALIQSWFQVKIFLLVLLFIYYVFCGRIRRQLAAGRCKWSVRSLRFWNETATVLLFTIVFTAVFKRTQGATYGLVAVAILSAVGTTVFILTQRKR